MKTENFTSLKRTISKYAVCVNIEPANNVPAPNGVEESAATMLNETITVILGTGTTRVIVYCTHYTIYTGWN